MNIKCVPTSFQSKQLIALHKLTLTSPDENPIIDVTIDGADEVHLQLNCIKGGGGCLVQEKIVAFAAKKLVIIADHRKEAEKLGEQWTQGVVGLFCGMAEKAFFGHRDDTRSKEANSISTANHEAK
ncbi:hypothetical protein PsorP6_001902 [Peronosclerospora sorghi]|uniref:Uncharacterized protein n=1 Tax=Peronosclerospora sorghi TaxID=230839 RepID=A0ACC0WWG3_9STRA|nr:hypothetical protein PsorP6_001902 [Peronosclerospora sorghi]